MDTPQNAVFKTKPSGIPNIVVPATPTNGKELAPRTIIYKVNL